jgi:hypothetical protein
LNGPTLAPHNLLSTSLEQFFTVQPPAWNTLFRAETLNDRNKTLYSTRKWQWEGRTKNLTQYKKKSYSPACRRRTIFCGKAIPMLINSVNSSRIWHLKSTVRRSRCTSWGRSRVLDSW